MVFQNTFNASVGQVIQSTGTVTVGGLTVDQSSTLDRHAQALRSLAAEVEKRDSLPESMRTAATTQLVSAADAIERKAGRGSIKDHLDKAVEVLKGSTGFIEGATELAEKIGGIWALVSNLL
jgi:cation transport ATPase